MKNGKLIMENEECRMENVYFNKKNKKNPASCIPHPAFLLSLQQ